MTERCEAARRTPEYLGERVPQCGKPAVAEVRGRHRGDVDYQACEDHAQQAHRDGWRVDRYDACDCGEDMMQFGSHTEDCASLRSPCASQREDT